MMNALLDATKQVSYFLWEYSRMDDTLRHWYCAEDMACYFQDSGLLSAEEVTDIRRRGPYSGEYIAFVRHIAFRVYIYTARDDSLANWYMAERLLGNTEWCAAITQLAAIYDAEKGRSGFVEMIRSSKVKKFYE